MVTDAKLRPGYVQGLCLKVCVLPINPSGPVDPFSDHIHHIFSAEGICYICKLVDVCVGNTTGPSCVLTVTHVPQRIETYDGVPSPSVKGEKMRRKLILNHAINI